MTIKKATKIYLQYSWLNNDAVIYCFFTKSINIKLLLIIKPSKKSRQIAGFFNHIKKFLT
jgi:hypothetical protein